MTRQLFTLSLGFGLLTLCATYAFGQPARQCGPRDDVVSVLSERYGETRRSIGIGSNNRMMEVYASEETGTWTILVTFTDGTACLMAAGRAFEALTDAPVAPKGTSL